MAVQKLLPLTLATPLLALSASAILHADDPSDDGCTQTRDTCWQEVFCDMVSQCLEQADGSSTAFHTCLMNDAVVGHDTCTDNICPDSYAQQLDTPTNKICNDLYKERKEYCKFEGPDRRICGLSSNFGTNSGARDALKAACAQAARNEWLACLADASPNIDPSAFSEGVVTDAAIAAGNWSPASGVDTGSILLVPMSECSAQVDRAIVEAMIWNGSEWEWVVIGEFLRGRDMCTEVSVHMQSIPSSMYSSDLDLLISWMSGDEQIWGSAYDLPIAESGIPGDFNRDGDRNTADLSAFIDAYDHNAPRADRNHDGVVNAADLELFLTEFDAG
ncbi:MAG: GC-type dockerin domain-anchored protein [Phycisphaerales bacterium JB065]